MKRQNTIVQSSLLGKEAAAEVRIVKVNTHVLNYICDICI